MSLKEKLRSLFGAKKPDREDFLEDVLDVLIEGDMAAKTAGAVVEALKKRPVRDEEALRTALLEILTGYLKEAVPSPEDAKVNLYLLLGVNGVGKTTTAAKLASYYRQTRTELPLVLAAADTFRAAAIDQLKIHGEKLGCRVIAGQSGGDPGAVVFDAASHLASSGGGLALVDTAGRLHNKENLLRELQKIDRIASAKAAPGCYKKLLIIDATTGQNALRQAETFHEAVGVDYVVITKADSTGRGGAAFSVCRDLGIPIAYVCTGEGYSHLAPFYASRYAERYIS